jgi:acetylornithine deacetylase/succinyl-diaminopimelate desuccinylase-like protein
LHELRLQFEHMGPDTDTLNIGQIHGDGTYNQVPSKMSAQVEFRLATDESYERIKDFVEELCRRHGLQTTGRAFSHPLRQDIDNPLLQAFMASITKVTSHHPSLAYPKPPATRHILISTAFLARSPICPAAVTMAKMSGSKPKPWSTCHWSFWIT